jgi:hypothetical protein
MAMRFKWLTVVWAALLGLGVIALAGSMLLPSTKRARVDWGELRRMREQEELAAAAATQPATAPGATAPAATAPAAAEPAAVE